MSSQVRQISIRICPMLLVITLLLAGCGGATNGAASAQATTVTTGAVPAGATPTTIEKVSLIYPGPGNFIFLPFEVARLKGFYTDEGLAVDTTYGKTGPAGVTALNSGNADFAGTTIDLALTSA